MIAELYQSLGNQLASCFYWRVAAAWLVMSCNSSIKGLIVSNQQYNTKPISFFLFGIKSNFQCWLSLCTFLTIVSAMNKWKKSCTAVPLSTQIIEGS